MCKRCDEKLESLRTAYPDMYEPVQIMACSECGTSYEVRVVFQHINPEVSATSFDSSMHSTYLEYACFSIDGVVDLSAYDTDVIVSEF